MFNSRQNFSFSKKTQQVINIGLTLAGTTLLSLLTAQSARSINVTFEAPGTQESTASDTFLIDFDDRENPENPDEIDRPTTGAFESQSVTDSAGITYTYSRLDLLNNRYRLPQANDFGGAGGTGSYITNAPTAGNVQPDSRYRISSSEDQLYFGFWWTAGDIGNAIDFFNDGELIFTFETSDVISAIPNTPGSTITARDGSSTYNTQDYYGNPNNGANTTEPYAFINFYAGSGEAFDTIEMYQINTIGRFESDNHTFSTTSQALSASSVAVAVPFEFSPSLGLLLSGGGLLGMRFLKKKQTAKLNK